MLLSLYERSPQAWGLTETYQIAARFAQAFPTGVGINRLGC